MTTGIAKSASAVDRQVKLEEAEFFLRQMDRAGQDTRAVRFNLSAFLSAARSVLQYAFDEIKSGGNEKWWGTEVSRYAVVKFMKERRNINIHEKPANVTARTKVGISETVGIEDSVHVLLMDSQGQVIQEAFGKSDGGSTTASSGITVARDLIVEGWQGQEDLFSLCEKYLEDIGRIVEAGSKQGVLK